MTPEERRIWEQGGTDEQIAEWDSLTDEEKLARQEAESEALTSPGLSDAAEAAWDLAGSAWDTVAGVNDYRADPYFGALDEASGHKANLYNQAATQRQVSDTGAAQIYDSGQRLGAMGEAYGNDVQNAAGDYADSLYGVGDQGMADAQAWGGQIQDLGRGALTQSNAYSKGLSDRASGLEGTGDAWADILGEASADMMGDPSGAELAGRAAMDRAASEATARAASARGGNANLQIRDANAMTAASNRQLTADMMAARATEMANRRALQASTLGNAGQTALAGRTAGASTYGAAANTAAAGRQQATDAYTQAANQVATGRQQQANAYNAGATVGMGGETARADLGLRGAEGTVNASTQGANAANQGQANAANTMGMAADTGMNAQQVTAGSVNAANSANAGITSQNATNQSDTIKDVASTAAMAFGASDMRVKTDIRRLSDPQANREALAPMDAYEYRYKDDIANAMGEDTEPRVGIMAQELEQSPAGDEVVDEGPYGKQIDLNRAVSFSLAANAGLDKRLRQLESRLGRGA